MTERTSAAAWQPLGCAVAALVLACSSATDSPPGPGSRATGAAGSSVLAGAGGERSGDVNDGGRASAAGGAGTASSAGGAFSGAGRASAGNAGAVTGSGGASTSRGGASGASGRRGAAASGGMPSAGSGGAGAGGGALGGAGRDGRAGNASVAAGDLVVAPDGVDAAPGTVEQPTTLASALVRVAAGHSIFVRGGRYVSAAQITIASDNSGTQDEPKRLVPYETEQPVLDFSSEPYGTGSNPRGLQINGSFWYVRGLEVSGAADNGIYVAGNGNVIEDVVTHGNRDTGLQLGRASSDDTDLATWPSNNLILNCESYDNYDAPPGSGENADGFAAKLTVGPGNVFRGCISHNNIDDGWDLYTKHDTGPIGPVTIDQCISYANGTLTDGTSNANGDRNGFKLGGDDIAVAHVVTRSVAFRNGKNGFTWNSNPGAIRLSNDLAFDNVEGNFKFGDSGTMTAAVFTNNVSLWTSTADTQSDKALGTDTAGTNAWWDKSKGTSTVASTSIVVTAADFASSLASPLIARRADHSPNFTPFALAATSDLVDAGALPPGELPFDAGSYYEDAPDLGAVELAR
jgi:hypothetical protein